MRHAHTVARASLAAFCLASLAACAGGNRAMEGYYANHPEMMGRILGVRTVFVEDVRGARDGETAAEMRECIVDELGRRGRGRFRIAASPEKADAVLRTDMTEELGPVPSEEPLPFTLETKLVRERAVYARMKLVEPKTGRMIYKTDTKERYEFDVDSVPKAAYTVVKNLLNEIEHCRRAIAP